jgi:hypothetical protein
MRMTRLTFIGVMFLMVGLCWVKPLHAVDAAAYEAAGNQMVQSGDQAKAVQYFQAAVQ